MAPQERRLCLVILKLQRRQENLFNKNSCLNKCTKTISLRKLKVDNSGGAVFTARKRSCGKVMFLHLSAILFTGGVCLPLGPGGGCLPLGRGRGVWLDAPWADPPSGQTPPLDRYPPPLGSYPPPGWYTSYWNAFLFLNEFKL